MKYLWLALALAMPACGQEKMTVLLDWFVNPDHGPIIVALQKGYFADEGLTVELVSPSDPSSPPRLVAAGRGDVAISYQPSQHLNVAAGLPLVRVGALISTPLNCLLVVRDGPVRSIADLEGRKVGYSVAGIHEAVLETMLLHHGLAIEDIELVNVNFSLGPSVMSGQVDGVIGAFRNFELNQMAIEGIEGRCFHVEDEGVPLYEELIYVANVRTMNIDRIRRFLRATARAVRYIASDPELGWEVFRNYSRDVDDVLNARAWRDSWPLFAREPEALDEERYERFETFLSDAGLIEGIRPVRVLARDLSQR